MANLSNINNKFLVTDGGKVGIGITAPTGILHTDQTFSGYAPVTFKNSVTNQGQFLELITSTDEGSKYTGIESISLQTGNGWKVWGGGNNFGEMYLSVSGAHAIVIKNDLKVGIGTTSPSTFLQVSGQGNRAGGNIQMGLSSQGANKWSYLTGTHYNSTTEPEGFALIGGYSDIDENRVVIGGDIWETNPATSIHFWTHNSSTHAQGGSQKMVINSDGNVGIGTTSPSSFNSRGRNLVVNSNGDTGITISANTTSSSTLLFADAFAGTGGTAAYRGAIEYDHADDSMAFSTSAAEKMRIDGSGNVGIGLTGPTAKLHVFEPTANTGVTLKVQSYSWDAALSLINDQSTWEILNDRTGLGTNGTLAFYNGGYRMALTPAGNLGIGTTSPAEELDVVGSGGNTNIRIYDSSANSEVGLKLQSDAKTWTLQNWGSGGDKLRVLDNSGNSVQTWDNNGNVGIGTVDPDITGFGWNVLSIVGGTTAGSAGVLELGAPSTDANNQNYGIIAFMGGTGRNAQIASNRDAATNDGRLSFWTSPGAGGIVERMRIDSSGNVGIGTVTEFPLTITKNTTSGLNSGVMLSFNGVGAYSTGYRFLSEASGSAQYLQVLFDGNTLKWKQWNGSSYAEKMVLYDAGRLHPTGGVFLGSSNNSNLLDDYEEGTWTPTIVSLGGAAATLSTANGTYTKIGRKVFLNYNVQMSSKASMTGNYVLLGGLPFNHPTTDNGTGTIDKFNNMTTAFSSMAWDTTSTGSVCWLVGVEGTSATSSVYVTVAEISDTTKFKGTIIYHT